MRSVKIYAGEDGKPKGDGLVVFEKDASVFGATQHTLPLPYPYP